MKKSLDIKLEKIASGDRSPKNFIIADAKDADMAGGIVSAAIDGSEAALRLGGDYGYLR